MDDWERGMETLDNHERELVEVRTALVALLSVSASRSGQEQLANQLKRESITPEVEDAVLASNNPGARAPLSVLAHVLAKQIEFNRQVKQMRVDLDHRKAEPST